MRIAIPHHTTQVGAKARVEELLVDAKAKHGHLIKDLEQHWDGDVLAFSFKTQGMKIQGTLEVTSTDVVMDASLPIFAKPFEPKIRQLVEKEGNSLFVKA